jgi:hypothetical protein
MIYGWSAVPCDVKMPKTGQTVNSDAFPVVKNAISMAIHTPTFVGGATTVKLQSLDHGSDVDAETWRDIAVFNLADGTFIPLAAIPPNQCTTLPITATGGGLLRFVANADQSAAASIIKVDFLCV